jgi:hypothetical protein
MLENDSRTMALTGSPPGAALNRISYSTTCALQFLRPWTRRPATRSKSVTGRHNADFRRVLVHFEDLGAWWPMLDTTWDLTSGSWPKTREGSSWARFWAARLVGTRRFPC